MTRVRVRRLPPNTYELMLNLSNRHIHAQLLDRHGGRVILAAHTTEPSVREQIAGPNPSFSSYATASVEAARKVGEILGKRANDHGIRLVYWRRPGKYHGKIKAFIDAVRQSGIETKTALPADMPPVEIPEQLLVLDENGSPISQQKE